MHRAHVWICSERLCARAYTHIYTCVYKYICRLCTYTCVYVCTYIHACMHTYIHRYVYIHTYIHTYHIYIYIYIYIHIYICVCVSVYACKQLHIHRCIHDTCSILGMTMYFCYTCGPVAGRSSTGSDSVASRRSSSSIADKWCRKTLVNSASNPCQIPNNLKASKTRGPQHPWDL